MNISNDSSTNVLFGSSSLGGISQNNSNNFNNLRAPFGKGLPQQAIGQQSMYGLSQLADNSNGGSVIQSSGQPPIQRGTSAPAVGQMPNGTNIQSNQSGGTGSAGLHSGSVPRSLVIGGSTSSNFMYDALGGISQSDPKPFDLSDFPTLGNQSSLNSTVLGENSIASNQMPYSMHLGQRQQNSAFAIQKEDFPALSGGFASSQLSNNMDLKDNSNLSSFGFRNDSSVQSMNNDSQLFERRHPQLVQNPKSIQSAHPVHRSSNLSEQSSFGVNGTDMSLNLAPGSLKGNSSAPINSLKSSPVHAQTIAPKNVETARSSATYDNTNPNHKYGLLGLLGVIRMEDADRGTLALGTDLTSLGLNLNSSEALHTTFASPWADGPSQRDPPFQIPQCYLQLSKGPGGKNLLKPSHFQKFQLESLFYIFYAVPRDLMQVLAAQELYNREWRYHTDYKLWFAKEKTLPGASPSNPPEYVYFDINSWERRVFNGALPGRGTEAFMREEVIHAAMNPALTAPTAQANPSVNPSIN